MTQNIVAECLDARYEEDIEVLLVFCYLREMGVKRVLPLHRCDLQFQGNPIVPHEEMHKTAQMWKGKPFNLTIITDEKESSGPDLFKTEQVMIGNVGTQMHEIADKMSTDEWILKFKTDDLFRRLGKKR